MCDLGCLADTSVKKPVLETAGIMQVMGRSPFGADWYVLGDALTSYAAAEASNSDGGLFTANQEGVSYRPRLLDYGSGKQSLPL